MTNHNRTIEQVKEYLLSKETRTEVEEELLKMIDEDLNHFPVLRISRANIEQVGFFKNNITDDMMLDVADKLEDALCNTGCWDSLKIILDETEGFHKDDTIFCPACGGHSSFFYLSGMYFMCDDCDHTWKQLQGIMIKQPLTDDLMEKNFEPLFNELIPEYSHYQKRDGVILGKVFYEVFKKGYRNPCMTIYEDDKMYVRVNTGLLSYKQIEI